MLQTMRPRDKAASAKKSTYSAERKKRKKPKISRWENLKKKERRRLKG